MPSGAVRQSGLNARGATPRQLPALFVRGVVVATYVTDDPQLTSSSGQAATAVYCDVLTYSGSQGPQRILLPKCLVCQDFGGMQHGVLYKPRAATLDVSGQPLDLGSCAIGQLDGDHVLCTFLDGNLSQPLVIKGLPHPSADIGQEANQGDNGAHLKLRLVDGSPYIVKNHGSYFGIDDTGSFVADTRYANDGSLTSSGAEPGPPTDGTLGNQTQRLHANAQRLTQFFDMSTPTEPVLALQELLSTTQKLLHFAENPANFQVSDASGNAFEVSSSGVNASAQLGSGAVHVAIAEHLEVLYDTLYTWLTTHVHSSATGPTTPPTGAAPPMWDASVSSKRLSLPDG